jgi:hypothetical protein
MVNSPSQPFGTKHLIWFRDRAKNVTEVETPSFTDNASKDLPECHKVEKRP